MHLALTAIYNLVLAPCLAERYKVNGPIVIYCVVVYIGPDSDSSMRNFSQIKKRRRGAREEKKTQQGESPLIVGSGLAILLRRSPLLWFVLCACCSCSKQHNVFLRSGGGEHRLTEWQMGPAKLHMMGSDCLSLYVKEFLKEITCRSAFCAPWIHMGNCMGR